MPLIMKMFSYVSKIISPLINQFQTEDGLLSFDDVSETSEEDIMAEEKIENAKKEKKGLFYLFKRNTSELFENYRATRRLILLFLLLVNGYLVYITSTQYTKTDIVDANWVSVVEIYSGILVVVTCYYLHLRSKDITSARGTRISNAVGSNNGNRNSKDKENISEND